MQMPMGMVEIFKKKKNCEIGKSFQDIFTALRPFVESLVILCAAFYMLYHVQHFGHEIWETALLRGHVCENVSVCPRTLFHGQEATGCR